MGDRNIAALFAPVGSPLPIGSASAAAEAASVPRGAGGEKRVLVFRVGAHGDAIQASSLFPVLKAQGWKIAFDTSQQGEEAVRHDPHLDIIMVTQREFLKEADWKDHINRRAHGFHRCIILNEATEGALLKMPDRLDFYWPDAVRRKLCNVNYVEFLHTVADVPFAAGAAFAGASGIDTVNRQRFYPTEQERRDALAFKRKLGKPIVAWALRGSALHKIWPGTARGMVRVLAETDAHIVAFGSEADKELGKSIVAFGDGYHADFNARTTWLLGSTPLRNVLALCQVADVVVGPETVALNAVANEPNAKVVLLSHSTRENLTRDWANTHAIEPDATAAPCWPCHRMHHDTKYCPQDAATQMAACASSISVDAVVKPIVAALRAAGEAASALKQDS